MKVCLSIIVSFCAATAYSQVSMSQGPKVNGLGLGATRQDVVKKFGKPLSQTKRDAGECVGGLEMTLKYPGLKLVLFEDPDDKRKFTIGEFEVTSEKWDVSGVRVGQADTVVRKTFGTRSEKQKQSGLPVWIYYMDENISPGSTNIHFRNKKVVKIISLWQMC